MKPTTESVEHEVAHPSRYGLSTLFYVTAVIAAAIALVGVGGAGWAVLVLGFWFSNRSSKTSIARILIWSVGIGILIWMLLPPIRMSRPYAIRTTHSNQMKQICLAVLNYESANGHFPPAYIADDDGKPMHSWRVLILPYLEEQALFKQYDFDEPWNGPNNSKLANKLPYAYTSIPFAQKNENSAMTGFKLVTGPETAFVKDQTKGFGDITAGSSNVIMLVDDNAKPVNWMSPEDATLEEATKLFNRENAKPNWVYESKFEIHRRYFNNVGMFDGAVHRTGFLGDESEMREHFTIATPPETPLNDVDFEYVFSEHESKPGGYLLVVINFFLAVLPAFRTRKIHQTYELSPTGSDNSNVAPPDSFSR